MTNTPKFNPDAIIQGNTTKTISIATATSVSIIFMCIAGSCSVSSISDDRARISLADARKALYESDCASEDHKHSYLDIDDNGTVRRSSTNPAKWGVYEKAEQKTTKEGLKVDE